MVFLAVASTLVSSGFAASALVPSGSFTTASSGTLSPPLPYTRRISWLVSQPSRPGTLKRWSSASRRGRQRPCPPA